MDAVDLEVWMLKASALASSVAADDIHEGVIQVANWMLKTYEGVAAVREELRKERSNREAQQCVDWQFKAQALEVAIAKYKGVLETIVGFADLMADQSNARDLAVMFIAAAKDARAALSVDEKE